MADEQISSAEIVEQKKTCIHCKTSIPADSKICSVCKFSQSGIWSWVQLVSPSTALIVASISALAWFVGLLPKLRSQFWPRTELVLLRCNSIDGAVLYNAGDLPVFVSHITLLTQSSVTITPEFPVDEIVEPGKLLKVSSSVKKDFDNLENGFWEPKITPEKASFRLKDAASASGCTRVALFAESDPILFKFRAETHNDLHEVPAAGYLNRTT